MNLHKKSHALALSIALLLVSCGSIDSDAKKAARLTDKSIEQTNKLKFEDAQKSYREARKIIRKYKDNKKAEKFDKLYRRYRDEGKYPQHGK